ncbi:MAG: hypothetical protein KY429_01205 [Actinobacteria bacterium]|nr:hypothetical protein [Actinomycetota bacterium]
MSEPLDPSTEGDRTGKAEIYSEDSKQFRVFGISINLPEPARSKETKMTKVMKYGGIGLGISGLILAGVALMGWVLMMLVGAVYHEFGLLRPIGFLPSTGIAAGLYALLSLLRGDSKVVTSSSG